MAGVSGGGKLTAALLLLALGVLGALELSSELLSVETVIRVSVAVFTFLLLRGEAPLAVHNEFVLVDSAVEVLGI